MKIIGFAGKAGVGKTTSATHLGYFISQGRDNFVPIAAFADLLKVQCGKLFGLAENQLHGYRKEVIDPRYRKTPRQIMQEYGQAVRDIHYNAWVDATMREIDLLYPHYPVVLIHDVRYPNEVEAIRARGGRIYLLRRDTGREDAHISENAIEGWSFTWDGVIENNGTLAELYEQVEEIVQ